MQVQKIYQAAMEQLDAEQASADRDVLIEESQAIALEMETASREIARLSDIADSLQDVAYSVESIKDASPQHLLLVEACLNMAQAGTYQNAESIQPGLESYLGTSVSMEGVVGSIRNIVATILRLMRQLYNSLTEFFMAIFSEIGRLRLRLQYAHAQVAEIEGTEPKRDTVSLGSTVYAVSTETTVPKDARALVVSLTDMLHQTKVMRNAVVPVLFAVGEQLNSKLQNWPAAEQQETWLKDLNDVASGFDPHGLAHHIGQAYVSHSPEFPHGAALTPAPLPGCRSLVFVDGRKAFPDKAEGSPIDRAYALQAHGIYLNRQKQSSNHDPKATMPTLTNDQLSQIVHLVEEIAHEVEAGIKGGIKSKLLNLAKPNGRIEKQLAGSDDADLSVGTLRRALKYWPTYCEWVRSSYVQLLAHDLMVCRAVLALVSRHCAAHR